MRKSRIWTLVVLIFLVAVVAGCDSASPASVTLPQGGAVADKQAPATPTGETMQVTVYYATKDAMHLAPEVRTLPKNEHPAQSAVELLLAEPATPDLARTLPEGIKLRGLTVKDHVAYVDFNDKLIKNRLGSTGEILVVGAIVNTLTEFADIHKVQILVDGKKIETLYGHLDTSEPLSRSETLIKK